VEELYWFGNIRGRKLFMIDLHIRNVLKLLCVCVQAKDCLHLLHLWYAKRELETRRVKNKSFEGVDIHELDLIEPAIF
jgi:hypothetical protein